MAKEKKFASLTKIEAQKKLSELEANLVKFRVSADASFLPEKSGVAGIRREIRMLTRLVATKA
jgi:ribosomal protein L29